MKKRNFLFALIITLVITLFFLLLLFKTSIIYPFLTRPQTGELNFTIIPEKTQVKEGEIFKIHIILTNVGNGTINLLKLKEQVSYDVIFSYPNGSKVFYECGRIERVPLTNKDLIEVNSGKSLKETIESRCWSLSEGEYLLNAIYHTHPGERITKPYWIGRKQSNNVTIFVQ